MMLFINVPLKRRWPRKTEHMDRWDETAQGWAEVERK